MTEHASTDTDECPHDLGPLIQMVANLNEVFAVLDAKRVTLEEKMIRYYFYNLSTIFCEMITRFNDTMQERYRKKKDAILLQQAKLLTGEISDSVGDFLKAARYDLNYLEQYYEHKFLELLENNLLFMERARKINEELAKGINS